MYMAIRVAATIGVEKGCNQEHIVKAWVSYFEALPLRVSVRMLG